MTAKAPDLRVRSARISDQRDMREIDGYRVTGGPARYRSGIGLRLVACQEGGFGRVDDRLPRQLPTGSASWTVQRPDVLAVDQLHVGAL
jgi:hypothetical protein